MWPKTFNALDRRHDMNEQQWDVECLGNTTAARTSLTDSSLKSTGAITRPTAILDKSMVVATCIYDLVS